MEKERVNAVVIMATKYWDNNEAYESHMNSETTNVIGVYSDYKMAGEKIEGYMNTIKRYLDGKLISAKARGAIANYVPANCLDSYFVTEVKHDKRTWWLEWDFGEYNRLEMQYDEFYLDDENPYRLSKLLDEAL